MSAAIAYTIKSNPTSIQRILVFFFFVRFQFILFSFVLFIAIPIKNGDSLYFQIFHFSFKPRTNLVSCFTSASSMYLNHSSLPLYNNDNKPISFLFRFRHRLKLNLLIRFLSSLDWAKQNTQEALPTLQPRLSNRHPR